jgi:cytochrome c biogenesis protein
MKRIRIKNSFKIFTSVKFAIFLLFIIALASSLGSFIEQDESKIFYELNYTLPIYGFIDYKFIALTGIDHVYRTWWFLSLLILLSISLLSCTITRQFPIVKNSKEYFFKKQKKSFLIMPFFVNLKNNYYLKEVILLKSQKLSFYLYQNKNLIYGYKGLIGRISPILVHISLLIILSGSSLGAFKNFKAQEVLPKGEIFHVQNLLKVGWFTSIPSLTIRVNDFWIEYENHKIHQFYSNLSILDNYANEIKNQTISVNNPCRYKNIDIYQSDWNLIGIRAKEIKENIVSEYPLFLVKNQGKTWITWIKTYTLVFDQLQNTFLLYDKNGQFLKKNNINERSFNNISIIETLASTGLLIKYDPSIPIIYSGFVGLMITTTLSYFPYTQIWIVSKPKYLWIGGITNRGKIQLEIEFENLIREIEKVLFKFPVS